MQGWVCNAVSTLVCFRHLMIIYVVQGEAADPDNELANNQSQRNEVCITRSL